MIDKYIKKLIKLEEQNQEKSINLIASENYINENILKLQSSSLSNKYAEGYSKSRYYGGCKYINKVELYAINLCKKLFKVNYVNVQPHSGSQANQAIYLALCNPKDKILSLYLKDGGHLSHGSKINYSGHFYTPLHYNLNINGYINYNHIYEMAIKYKPKLIIAGASAYSRIINWSTIKKIANKTNSFFLADISHIAGLITSNVYPSPVGIADVITSTLQKTLNGPRGGLILTNKRVLINKVNKAVFPGLQGGPFMNIIAAKALCFKYAMSRKFKINQKTTIKNAKLLSTLLKNNGFSIISYGTDTHLFLINLNNINLTGLKAQIMLENVNIITNKNTIPMEQKKSTICTGIRLGTPAITTRGFKSKEIVMISKWITDILIKKVNKKLIKLKIINLCNKFSIYNT